MFCGGIKDYPDFVWLVAAGDCKMRRYQVLGLDLEASLSESLRAYPFAM